MSPEVAHSADDGRRPGRPVTGVHLPRRQSGSAGFQKRASGISLCLRFRLQQGRDFLDDCNVLLSHFAGMAGKGYAGVAAELGAGQKIAPTDLGRCGPVKGSCSSYREE